MAPVPAREPAFLVFLIPVLVQVALKSDQLLEFLGDSGQRATTCLGTTTSTR